MKHSTTSIYAVALAVSAGWAGGPAAAEELSRCGITVRSETAGDWTSGFQARLDDAASDAHLTGEEAVFVPPPGAGVALLCELGGGPGPVFSDVRNPSEGAEWWGGDAAGADLSLRLVRYGYDPADPAVPVQLAWDLSGAGEWHYALFDDDKRVLLLSGEAGYPVAVPDGGVTLRLYAFPGNGLSNWQNVTGLQESDAAWGDFDGDGDLDVVLCGKTASGVPATRTYENQSGTLTGRQDLVGVHSTGSGALAWGDYDGDGDLDLALAGMSDSGRVARIYENDGAGNLTWDAAQALTGVSGTALAWGDCDGDGDLDLILTGHDGSERVSILYRNDPPGNLTADGGQTLTGLTGGSADWADWDGDGDPDLLLTGHDGVDYRTIFYLNDPVGTLTDDGAHGLPGGNLSDTAWGDYDADGDLDLAFTACTSYSGPNVARVYENDGAGGLTQVAEPLSIYRSSCAWGDYDNDGDLDVAFCGYDGGYPGMHTRVYENTGSGFSERFSLAGLRDGSLSWADVEGDGDPDLFLTGFDWSTSYGRVYENAGGVPNTAPAVPTDLSSEPDCSAGGIVLRWQAAAAGATPSAGLYYCVRVGTTPGGHEVMSGTYGTPLMGNAGQATELRLEVPPGVYYWSVRAIDSGLAASAWSGEQVCHFGLGDADGDGDADLDDFVEFRGCLNGPGDVLPDSDWRCFDFDGDLDLDLADFAGFQEAFSG